MKRQEQGSSEEINSNLPDYTKYKLNKKELCVYYICAFSILAALGFLFYRTLMFSLICGACSLFFKGSCESFLRERRQNRLLEGFRDTLYIIAGAVAAGRQMPQALEDAHKQCIAIYGEKSDICRELETICTVYNQTHGELENLLMDFGKRSGLAEIIQFASSYDICRKNGGDVESVCMKSANILLDKIEFVKEAKAMISEKKMDIILLTAMPLGMVFILNITSFSYIAPLYGNAEGRMIMTICLIGIALALKSGLKITNIKV